MHRAELKELQFQRRLLASHLGKLMKLKATDRVILTEDITVMDEIRTVCRRLQDIKTKLSFHKDED